MLAAVVANSRTEKAEFPMTVELEQSEIELLIEALDCLKTKFAFTKGLSRDEKTGKIVAAEALETKLRQALSA